MTRVGPNQDINDPTALENLRLIAEEVAVITNDHNNAYNGITESKSIDPSVHPDNTRIIAISTLLQKEDGSDAEITGFNTDGTYKQENLDLYTESIINTHINQAERFRNYYDAIVSIINSWSDRDNGIPIVTPSIELQTTTLDVPPFRRGWAKSNINIVQKDGYLTVDNSQIPISIDWSGNGPTNYNSNTYPQLMSEFRNLGLGEQVQPYFNATEVFSLFPGYYNSINETDGFTTTLVLFERTSWSDNTQRFAQVSDALPSQSDLSAMIGLDTPSLKIPIMVSNFTDTTRNIGYTIKVTMTPRNINNTIFQYFHAGFVNKRIWIVGPHVNDINTNFIQHNGSNTAEVNNMLTSDFNVQISDYVTVPPRSLGIATVQILFVNQLSIGNGLFADWDTEDLLCDINIQFTIGDYSINQNFNPGIERDMWNP